MVGSKDMAPSDLPFGKVFYYNQFKAKPVWPSPNTNLTGQTAIITGGNQGLGYEAALQLLGLKLSTLILAVRSSQRGEEAANKMRKLFPKARIEVWSLDLSSYDSVQAFARRVETDLAHVDMVLLNAGILQFFYSKNKSTGHEETLQVNYLSNMLLTVLLLPILKAKRGSNGQAPHLTIVSAALTLAAKFPERDRDPVFSGFDDPKLFTNDETYNSSKLLAHMFMWNLVDYVSADDVIVNLADPAWCKGTKLARDIEGIHLKIFLKIFASTTGRPPKVGASCFVDALVNKGKESHGCFIMSWKTHPFAAYLYTDEGRKVTQKVWNETMAELQFAGVQDILRSLKASS